MALQYLKELYADFIIIPFFWNTHPKISKLFSCHFSKIMPKIHFHRLLSAFRTELYPNLNCTIPKSYP